MIYYQKWLFLMLFAAVVALSTAQQCNNIPDNQKLDCLPDEKVVLNSSDTCISYGCCWNPPSNKSVGLKIGVPSCYFPSDHTGYAITGLQVTDFGHTAVLTYVGPAGRRSEIIYNLILEVYHYESSNIVRVKIVDAAKTRYEVRDSYPFRLPTARFSDKFNVTVTDNKLVIRDKADKLLFSTAVNAPIIYADQFIQISTLIESQYAYGFGETSDVFAKPTNTWRQYSLFALDQAPTVGVNAYGVHPFGMFLRNDASSYGMFLLNSNAMDIEITPQPTLTFRTIGGIIDLFLYAGDTPQAVIQQHWAVIGNPVLPQYWAFGFHLGRQGYGNQLNLAAVIKRNSDLGVPFDVQWLDVETLDRKRSWTLSTFNFWDLSSVVKGLHDNNRRVVPIANPATAMDSYYQPFISGNRSKIFIMNDNLTLIGRAWQYYAVFPDFTNDKAESWWKSNLNSYLTEVNFDGLWINMNEPVNFLNGSTVECKPSNYDDPPYVPQVKTNGAKLKFKTICMSSDQAQGKHYDLHSMYGHYEAKITYNALRSLDSSERPFVLTRSTFAGTGRYAHHWTGSIESSWEAMAQSIPDILNFNLFGIPFVGADVCGFLNNAEEEMCLRWTQLGAFYPFMRNYNDQGNVDQDPAAWNLHRAGIIDAIKGRYSIIPYLYTLHYLASSEGQTVFRPLWWHFPNDKNTWGINNQFMLGSDIMVIPVLTPVKSTTKTATVRAYFPEGEWYSVDGQRHNFTAGEIDIEVGLESIPVYYRSGAIIPGHYPSNTTFNARHSGYTLLVVMDYATQKASGKLYLDDGYSNNIETDHTRIEFQVSSGLLESKIPIKGSTLYYYPKLKSITFYGFKKDASFYDGENSLQRSSYDAKLEVMTVSVQVDLQKEFNITWSDRKSSASSNLVASAGFLALLLLMQQIFG